MKIIIKNNHSQDKDDTLKVSAILSDKSDTYVIVETFVGLLAAFGYSSLAINSALKNYLANLEINK